MRLSLCKSLSTYDDKWGLYSCCPTGRPALKRGVTAARAWVGPGTFQHIWSMSGDSVPSRTHQRGPQLGFRTGRTCSESRRHFPGLEAWGHTQVPPPWSLIWMLTLGPRGWERRLRTKCFERFSCQHPKHPKPLENIPNRGMPEASPMNLKIFKLKSTYQ